MITELKSSIFLNGNPQLVSLNKQDILSSIVNLYDREVIIEESLFYPTLEDIDNLEDCHNYQIIDTNIDNSY